MKEEKIEKLLRKLQMKKKKNISWYDVEDGLYIYGEFIEGNEPFKIWL